MNAVAPFYMKDKLAPLIEKFGFEIGDYTYGEPPLIHWWGEKAKLKIGKFCSIAANVSIYLGGNHRTDWITTYPFPDPVFQAKWSGAAGLTGHPATKGDVIIGNDVWLANESVVLSGVTIGDGAVVSTRAVVTKDVPPYTIVGGSPAHILKQRFPDQEIKQLVNMQWWNWDIEKINASLPLLCSGNIKELINRENSVPKN
jgi:acetyltransferase-like isoleucine patch superfamily enzyme